MRDGTKQPAVLSVPCRVPRNSSRPELESFGFTECPAYGPVEENLDSMPHGDISKDFSAFMKFCQKRNTQIQQYWEGKAAPTEGGGTGFTLSHRPPAPMNDPAKPLVGTVTGYTVPAPVDLSEC